MWKMKEWFLHYKEAIRVSLLALFRWTLLAVCTGVLCGGIGTLFHLAVEWVTEQRTEHVWLLWLLPAAGIAITALYKATGCVGKGTNDVLRAVQDGSSVTPWLVPAIFLGTVLTHLCGGSAGREGAALQMGGSIGWNIGRVLHFNNHDCRTATVCGMAAFFSALFGTPLTATLFAMMVVDVGLMLTVAFVPGFLAALIAYSISLKAGIAPTRFVMEAPPLDAWTVGATMGAVFRCPVWTTAADELSALLKRSGIPLYGAALRDDTLDARTVVRTAVLAMCCAVVAVIFCQMLHFFEHEIPKLLPNPWVRAAAGGAAVVALSYLMGVGRYNGAGMDVIMDAVELEQALPWDFVCKMVLTVLTLSVGFKGGEVVPSFYIGATFGCVVGPLLGLPAGFSAAVGLVCVFCGATNTLVASIVLAAELFSGAGFELMALACGLSYMFSGYHSLYSSQGFRTSKLFSEFLQPKEEK